MLLQFHLKIREETTVSLHHNARQFKEQIYSWFPKLNVRPYELLKQDNNKKITLLTADTPFKICELEFSGVILVTSNHPLKSVLLQWAQISEIWFSLKQLKKNLR